MLGEGSTSKRLCVPHKAIGNQMVREDHWRSVHACGCAIGIVRLRVNGVRILYYQPSVSSMCRTIILTIIYRTHSEATDLAFGAKSKSGGFSE